MTILITGASGFVGRSLVQTMQRTLGAKATIVATARRAAEDRSIGSIASLDVRDGAAVATTIAQLRPTHIVHLAGLALVASAQSKPAVAWDVHLGGTLNIAHAVLAYVPDCVLIHVGSGYVYGASAEAAASVDERTLLAPIGEYAATKAAADL